MLSFQVKDKTSGDPVAGANVLVGPTNVLTDASGTASFTEPTDVTATQVVISHAAYKSLTLPLTSVIAAPGGIQLERSGELPGVVITPASKKNLMYFGLAIAVYYVLRDQKMI